MPRHTHDNMRASHKEAFGLSQRGFDVVLVCKDPPAETYLNMQTVAANARAQSVFRPLINLPGLIRQALTLRADLYVLQNPDTLLAGIVLALLGKKVAYSTHEDFSQKALVHRGLWRPLRKLIGVGIVAVEHVMMRIATVGIASQPDVARRYGRRVVLAENAPLTWGPVMDTARRIQADLPARDCPTLVYAGILSNDRGLLRMLDLVVELNAAQPWVLKLLGPVYPGDDLEIARTHPGWRHVQYLGHVSHAEALAHIGHADIGLALLDDVGGYGRASITKLYEYMLMETPFVSTDFAYWRQSLNGTEAGLFVKDFDTVRLAQQIRGLWADKDRYSAMKRDGRLFILSEYSWEIVSKAYYDAVARSLSETRPGHISQEIGESRGW